MIFWSLHLLVSVFELYCSVSAKRLIKRDGLEFEYNLTFRNICYSDDNARLRYILREPINTCMIECALHGDCEIAQYQVRYHLCELFKSFNASEAVEKPGCVIVKKSGMDVKQLPCAEECQNGNTCDLESKQCVYKECKDTPSAGNGDILGIRKETDSKVRLQCDIDSEEAVLNTAVCQAHGSWSDFPRSCATPFECPESDMEYTTMVFTDSTTFTYRFVYDTRLDHTEALDYCKAEGAHLITTFPVTKRQVLLQLMRECSTKYRLRYWIDGNNRYATDFNSLTEWVTSTGEPLTTDFWKPGEPNYPWSDHCAYLYMEIESNTNLVCDWNCGTEYYFICEK